MATTLLPPITWVPGQSPSWFLGVGEHRVEALVTSRADDFRGPGHAMNFVSYLFRRGVEPPNQRTPANQIRWQGHLGSADGRDRVAAQVAAGLGKEVGSQWLAWRTETVFVVPPRPLLPVDEFPDKVDPLGLLADLVADLDLDIGSEAWVSHLDQATPPHLHRLYRVPGANSLYAEVGMALARGAVVTQAGPMARFISLHRAPTD